MQVSAGIRGNAPRIAICGVAGYNRGDDAIARAIASGIHARLPDAQVGIAMLRLGSIAPGPGIRPFPARRGEPAGLLGLVRAIATADLVILGGGSLIQDKFGGSRVKGVLGYAWLVARLAGLFRRPLVTAPLGIDTLESDHAKVVAAELLSGARAIFVRDQRSLDNGRALVADTKAPQPIRVCDPAFVFAARARPTDGTGPIVLSPAFEGECDDLVADVFARAATRLIETHDRDVVVIAMDDRHEEDGGAIARIVAGVPAGLRARVQARVPATLDEALAILHGASGLIAMRLHAMILSYAAMPIACLSRTTKTDAFMEDYRVPGTSMERERDPAAIAEQLVASVLAWPEPEAQRKILRARLADLDGFFDTAVAIAAGKAASATAA